MNKSSLKKFFCLISLSVLVSYYQFEASPLQNTRQTPLQNPFQAFSNFFHSVFRTPEPLKTNAPPSIIHTPSTSSWTNNDIIPPTPPVDPNIGMMMIQEWAQVKHYLPARKVPEFSTMTPTQVEAFIRHIHTSDFVITGYSNGKPIFADLTNGIAEIKEGDLFYWKYDDVFYLRDNFNSMKPKEIDRYLEEVFVTIHPRTNTPFHFTKKPIYQIRDSFNPILPSHPNYQIFERHYERTLYQWDVLRGELKHHEVVSIGPISEFDARPRLIDRSAPKDLESIFVPVGPQEGNNGMNWQDYGYVKEVPKTYTPIHLKYKVLLEVYEKNKKTLDKKTTNGF